MKSRSHFLALAIVACLTPHSGQTQVLRDYRCTIERVAIAQDPPTSSLAFQQKNFLNREFTVERRSGLMVGTLKNSFITKPQVIDLGSNDNSYKVITTLHRDQGAGAGSNVYTLVVSEYEKSDKKPFVFLENDYVYFGHCIHF